MKKKTKLLIRKYLVGNIIEFKVKIPVWLLCYVVGIPLLAYGDVVIFQKVNYAGYIVLCSVEMFLVWLGFTIASTTFKINKMKIK